jgi:hypothetical protein
MTTIPVEIKSWRDGKVLFTAQVDASIDEMLHIKAAVEIAVRAKADLRNANLSYADLRNAKNIGDFTMTDGLKFSQYLSDVVPALLTAGGKTLKDVVDSGAWDCHSWTNCPMAFAFGIKSTEDAPPLLRARVDEFVRLFDAKLIPKPEVTP